VWSLIFGNEMSTRLIPAMRCFFMIAALLTSSAVQAQPTRFNINPVVPPNSFKAAVEKGTRTLDGRPGPTYWTQYARYHIRTSIDPATKTLSGQVLIRYENRSPDTLRTLHLDLNQNAHAPGAMRNEPGEMTGGVTVHSLTVDGREPLRKMEMGTRLVVAPESPVAPGATVEVDVAWSFLIPQAGAGQRMGYDSGNVFFLAYWYPQMAVYDDILGWHPDPFLLNAEFYHGFADYELEITIPGGWVVMGTGAFLNPEETLAPAVLERYQAALVSDTPVQVVGPADFGKATAADSTRSLTWRFSSHNVRDVAFTATTHSVWESARTPVGEGHSQIHSFYRETAPYWRQAVRYGQHAVSFLSRHTGIDYPWPHMTAVEAGQIIGGGMEFPMMTIIGDYNQRGALALQSVTAHEIAHMWIPMIVSTDERRYSWIDEGYTTYHTTLANEDFRDISGLHRGTQAGYFTIAGSENEGEIMRRSDYHYSTRAFGIASYNKPAVLFKALHGVMGDERYREAYLDMMRTWAYKHMTPWDLFAHFNRHAGQDLSWFWRPWFFETGVLDQGVVSVTERRRDTVIRLTERGRNPMPYLLRLTLTDGSVHDVRIEASVVISSIDATDGFDVRVPFRNVVRVEIDPEFLFPDVERSNNVIDYRTR
jgi:hypothetical protein